jgi:putative two-component system response regulator
MPCDVVISDVHLPGMNGLDLAGLLLERWPLQPVVLMTADPDEALRREALARGPVSYLLKPFELFELEAALTQAVERQARAAAEKPAGSMQAASGSLPLEWLRYADELSYAGPGHADRVSRLARVISLALPAATGEIDSADLTVAAWSHEIGRLGGASSSPAKLAARGADMLQEMGCAPGVCAAVRHLHERWDGQGGPDGLSAKSIPLAAQVLAVADSIEHYCASWLQAGLAPTAAADRALALVAAQRGTVFSPMVTRAALRERSLIERICARPELVQAAAAV